MTGNQSVVTLVENRLMVFFVIMNTVAIDLYLTLKFVHPIHDKMTVFLACEGTDFKN